MIEISAMLLLLSLLICYHYTPESARRQQQMAVVFAPFTKDTPYGRRFMLC